MSFSTPLSRAFRNAGAKGHQRVVSLCSRQRPRVADASVELVGRSRSGSFRITFDILTFDDARCLDPGIFCEQQFARSELAIGQSIAVPDSNANTVDAASQFGIDHSGASPGFRQAALSSSRSSSRSIRRRDSSVSLPSRRSW